jgi:hypothetical protein
MKQIITIILVLIFSAKSIACECPMYNLKKLDNVSYEWSDIILIGEIIKTGTEYQIKVVEVLKGEIDKNLIIGKTIGDNEEFNNCTFYPDRKGEYLLYLKKTIISETTYYYTSQCLGSRLLNLDYNPVSLYTEKNKTEIISETNKWIDKLREEK